MGSSGAVPFYRPHCGHCARCAMFYAVCGQPGPDGRWRNDACPVMIGGRVDLFLFAAEFFVVSAGLVQV